MAQDDELAEQTADREEGRYQPRISEWSPTEQLLAAIFNRLGEVVTGLVQLGGGKASEAPGWPMPETARDRALRRKQQEEYDDLLDLVEQSKRRERSEEKG